jgi:hypothetical protein
MEIGFWGLVRVANAARLDYPSFFAFRFYCIKIGSDFRVEIHHFGKILKISALTGHFFGLFQIKKQLYEKRSLAKLFLN